jgi:hypothetical protein
MFKALRKQVKAYPVNPLDRLDLLRRQPCFHGLTPWVSEEFCPRAFVNIKLREKSLEA